jgi:hypothetical protein
MNFTRSTDLIDPLDERSRLRGGIVQRRWFLIGLGLR